MNHALQYVKQQQEHKKKTEHRLHSAVSVVIASYIIIAVAQ